MTDLGLQQRSVSSLLHTGARGFFDLNVRVSDRVDEALESLFPRKRGWTDFVTRVLPAAIKPGSRIVDVGSGKRPAIDLATKRRLGLHVVGLDVDADELSKAPDGCYDSVIVGDIASADLNGPYDTIISCAVLEHVSNTSDAISNMASALSPGGVTLHFIPCGLAPFALVNRALGPAASKRLLFALYPEKKASQGFEAYYRQCTPSGMRSLMRNSGLSSIEVTPYYASDYLKALAPAYVLEAARQLTVQACGAADLAESFCIQASAPAT